MKLYALVCFDSETELLSVVEVSEAKLQDFTVSPDGKTWECRDYMGKVKKNKIGEDVMLGAMVNQHSDIVFVFDIEVPSHSLKALDVTSKFAFQSGRDNVGFEEWTSVFG